MAKRISNAEAKEIFLAAGLKPLEAYKSSKVRVKCMHIECGSICYPMLEKVKIGQIGCKQCRYERVAKSLRLSEKEARAIMVKAGYRPLEVYINALTKWKCKHVPCGTIVYPLLNQIQQGGGGCLTCGHTATGLKKRHSAEAISAVLKAKRFKLIGKYHGANNKLQVRCEICGNEIEAIFAVITRGPGRGCKPCAVNESRIRYRMDLEEVRSRLKKANMKLLGDYENSNIPVACKCLKCGVVRNIRISVLLKGSGCRPCALAKAGKKRRTNEISALEIMRSLGKVEPLEPYQNQNAKWKSRCLTCGSIVYPRLGSITGRNGIGCNTCADKLRGIARRIPQSRAYEFLIENNLYPIPNQNYVDTESKIDCVHSCGRTFSTSYRRVLSNTTNGSGSCVPCARKKSADNQRFKISTIDKIYKKSGLKLLTRDYKGMRYKHETMCIKCKHKWSSKPSHISLGSGCPNCAKGGIKTNIPGYIYLISHKDLNAYKIGIANSAKAKLNDRLYHHHSQGWSLVKRWDFKRSTIIQAVEKNVLNELRQEMQIPPYLSKMEMPFGGWTETICADAISVSELASLIDIQVVLRQT